ncbi:MAG: hypothetical protein FJ276_01440 [Planctomycetes bacterium]|nr:hypothetical protein [Planctomycetota bacterium]
MSYAPNPWEPYVPPNSVGGERPSAATPTGLKAICILAIVLGGLGAFGAAMGGVGLAVGQSLQGLFSPPAQPGMDSRMVELQRTMQREMQEVTDRYLPFSIVEIVTHMITALMLLAGGAMTLNKSAAGRLILIWGCTLAIFYVLGQTVLNTVIQLRMLPIVQSFTDGMVEGAGGDAPPDIFPAIMAAAIWAGVAFGGVLAVVKLFFYAFAIVYLRKPHIAARFGS